MSATNNKWEIGVAVPVKNNFFRFPNSFYATIDSITSTSVTLSDLVTEARTDTISNACDVMAVGDTLQFKNSAGEVSGTTVTSVAATGLVVGTSSNMSSDFSSGDTIIGYGSVSPAMWYLSGYEESTMDFTIATGSDDNFSAKISIDADGLTGYVYLYQDIDTDYFISGINYRIGAKYKKSATALTTTLGMKVDSTENTVSLSSAAPTFTSTAGAVTITSGSCSSFKVFFRQYDSDGTHDAEDLEIDEFYLEHAVNPRNNKDISGGSTGYYEFADYPSLGSLSVASFDTSYNGRMLNGSYYEGSTTGWGERVEKYTVSCRYDLVNITFYEALREFLRVQKNGYLLNLHTYLDGVPGVLTGYLSLGNVNRSHFDLDLISFDLTFNET